MIVLRTQLSPDGQVPEKVDSQQKSDLYPGIFAA